MFTAQVVHFFEDDAAVWHKAICDILFSTTATWDRQQRAWKALERLPEDAITNLFEDTGLPLGKLLAPAPLPWLVRVARAYMNSSPDHFSCSATEAEACANWKVLAEVTELRALALTDVQRGSMAASDPISRLLLSLPALTSLDLTQLDVTGSLAADLARNFAAMPQLKALCLQGVWVPFENIRDLCSGITTLSSLTELNIAESVFVNNREAAVVLSEHLPALQLLQTLHADRSNDEGSLESVTEPLAAGLAALPALAQLDMGCHSFNEDDVEHLANALSGRRTLTVLWLRHCPHMGEFSSETLSTCVATLSGLAVLFLGGTLLTGPGFSTLAQALHNLSALSQLDLSKCGLGAEEAEPLAAALPHLPCLVQLSVCDNALGEDGMAQLGPAIATCVQLQVVGAGCCRLGGAGAAQLCEDLAPLHGLSMLTLNGNGITGDAAPRLAAALEQLSALRSLDVWDNALGTAGVAAVCSTAAALTALRLFGAGRDDNDGRGLAAALRPLTRLQVLNAGGHPIGPVGVSVLAQSLARLTALTELTLAKMNAQAAGFMALAMHLSGLTALRYLAVHGNGVERNSAARGALASGLRRCSGLRIDFD